MKIKTNKNIFKRNENQFNILQTLKIMKIDFREYKFFKEEDNKNDYSLIFSAIEDMIEVKASSSIDPLKVVT